MSLAAHCLDVALCFRALCELPAIRRALKSGADRELDDHDLDRLAVLAALHDVGKANRGFQYKPFDDKARKTGHVRELEPLFSDDTLSQALMKRLDWEGMQGWFKMEESALSYFLASFSHHGRPLRFNGERTGFIRDAIKWWQPDDQLDPMQGVSELMEAAQLAFPGAFEADGNPLPDAPSFHHRFAGLVMLADWLGSHEYWFPVEPIGLEDRLHRDREVIPKMLRVIGLDRAAFPLEDAPFQKRFLFPPRPLQALIEQIDPQDNDKRLLIAESETGSGKTEAALHWFGKLFAAGLVDSLYFALPTRVAARELYRRVVGTVERWFPDPDARPVTVLAVPGYAEVDSLKVECHLPDDNTRWTDDAEQRRFERRWAAEHPKRFLAATVAVGTIDQALLSVVQTAHAHLRSICLDRALLVVDEVHASDLYMSRLLEHLLRHHLGAGGRTLLLSATLGSKAWRRYVEVAGSKQEAVDIDKAAKRSYPTLTDATGRLMTSADNSGHSKAVRFETLPHALALEHVVEPLADALKTGARVLVVLNTVARANDLLRTLEGDDAIDSRWLFDLDGIHCPHHGRFAAADRVVLDRAVSVRLGKDTPNGPLLLIGTQTLEQSLDIDADLLVTDLAPADVLLQRVGRLHRHERWRPAGFESARCWLLTPDEPLVQLLNDGGDVAGQYKRIGYGSVYPDLRTLALTRDAIAERPNIEVPRDNRWLVERATHPEALAGLDRADERWQRHGQSITGSELMKSLQAGMALVDFEQYFGQFKFNESGGRVATRLGADTWRLPLEKPIDSPFGQQLTELQIPDHLAARTDDDILKIIESDDDGTTLQWGDVRYRYSRFGLEKLEKEAS